MDVKEKLRFYLDLDREIRDLANKIFDLQDQRRIVGEALTNEVPEDFVFSYDWKLYRFLMDVEDGGVSSVSEVENLDTWLAQQAAIAEGEDSNAQSD